MAQPQGTPLDKEAVFMMAQQEMEYRVGLFNGLVANCHDKCIERKSKDPDLNVGENSCIDRCVSKYWQGPVSVFLIAAPASLLSFLPCLRYPTVGQVTGIVGQMLGANKPGM